MKRILILLVLGFAAWKGYGQYQVHRLSANWSDEAVEVVAPDKAGREEQAPRFSCDGRTYCSQMRSCAEATYFLQNCPGVKMDGDHDGVPCEKQWCG